eukprot:4173065-Lingulodinium_polyedra.AAC.1
MLTKDQQLELWMTRDIKYPPLLPGLMERTEASGNAGTSPAAGPSAERTAATPSAGTNEEGSATGRPAAGSGAALL